MCFQTIVRGCRSLCFLTLLLPAPLLAQQLPIIAPATITSRLPICYDVYCWNSIVAMQENVAIETSSSGVAQVWTRTAPNVWAGTQVLFNPDEDGPPDPPPSPTYHDFGAPAAIDGRVLLISGGSSINPSAVYVFTRPSRVWTHAQTIVLPTPADYIRVTIIDVAFHEGTALILARYSNAATAYKQVHVYTRKTGEQFVHQGQIAPVYGNRLALRKSTALMVDPDADGGRGAVYTFERTGTQWTQGQKLMGTGTAPGDGFGSSFAFDGNLIVVSAPDQPNPRDPRLPGAVYTFGRYHSPWVERGMLLHEPMPPEFDLPVRFGESVSLSGARLLIDVGMPIAYPPRDPPPAVLYERRNGQWYAAAGMGCLNVQDAMVAGNAAILTYRDFSKPGAWVRPYELPRLGTAPPSVPFECE
ncbi:hypothetical protein HNQ60_005284 [Povalibacter uvarum]|uniref:Uncharacterized protein n=1 Tax=Povalibacter uvarum TaxID=732238 RepID=A0A841HWN5_9GAMM|nr:FG-GAP repeat protein [Povalibacter uvarum]MBB6096362.1 hypothetical protein [Povalibacter uvarum]